MIRDRAAVCALATACAFVAPSALGKENAAFHRDLAAIREPVASPRAHQAPPHAKPVTAPHARAAAASGKPVAAAPRSAAHAKPVAAESHAKPVAAESHAKPVAAESHAKPVAADVATTQSAPSQSPASTRTVATTKSGKKSAAKASKPIKLRQVRKDPPTATWTKYRREPWRRGYVSLFGHGKTWSGYIVDKAGDVPPAAHRAFSDVLASWRTGKEMLIDEHLIALIADVSDEFGGRPIRIVSGYREQSYAPDSKHKVGQAFDFSIPGVPNEALRDYLRFLPDTGVGYYPNSTHVHVDVRDKPTYWVDYSKPGEHPMYAWDKRVAGLTSAERALAAALDSIGVPDLGKSGPAEPKSGGFARTSHAPGASRARENDVSLSSVTAIPKDELAAAARHADAEDAGEDEAEPEAAAPLSARSASAVTVSPAPSLHRR